MKPRTALAISLAIAFAMLLSAGCITKSKELGCCVRNNATKDGKCYWFNMSNDAFIDMYPQTIYCNQTSEMCNVTIDSVDSAIPFCTDDNLTECIKPDCLAMACGDFAYAPQVAPGVASVQEAANEMPTSSTSTKTQALYNGQCRFLPLDSSFERIMKTSKSAVGDFRFGIGANFDEYDYYHYYFPISDKDCMINPTGTIDRYMNYLQPGTASGTYVAYDPTKMNTSCTSDAAPVPPASITPTASILPLTTAGTNAFLNVTITKALSMNPSFITDFKSYKYIDYLGYAWTVTLHPTTGVVDWPNSNSSSRLNKSALYYYEKLDKGFYREALSTAYIPEFYNTTVGRAPFECDKSAYECLSGECSNDFYSRGVNVVTDAAGTQSYVVTDCKSTQTVTGQNVVVCYPTINASNAGGTASFVYANVTYRPVQFTLATEDYDRNQLQDAGSDTENAPYVQDNVPIAGIPSCAASGEQKHDKCQLDWMWNNFFTTPLTSGGGYFDGTNTYIQLWDSNDGSFYNTGSYQDQFGNTIQNEMFGDPATVSLLPSDFSVTWDSTNNVVDSYVDTTGAYPPAGQIVFFDDQNVQYDGQTIVGYAVADPGQFEQTYFAKSCIFASVSTVLNYSFDAMPGGQPIYNSPVTPNQMVTICQDDCAGTLGKSGKCPADEFNYANGAYSTLSRCLAYCRAYINTTNPDTPVDAPTFNPEPPSPCNYTVTSYPSTASYIKVDLSGTGQDFYDTYQGLLTAFAPLYNDTMDGYMNDANEWNEHCDRSNSVDIDDLFFASMPWIPEYKKFVAIPAYYSSSGDDSGDGGGGGGGDPKYGDPEYDILNSPALNFFRDQDNIYQQTTSPYFAGNNLCNLQKASIRQINLGQGNGLDWQPMAYQALVPSTIYLLVGTKDSGGNMKIGRCDIEPGSTLPQIQSFGWCEPCTLTTLAYQKITAGTKSANSDNRVAIPSMEQELWQGVSPTTICSITANSPSNITTSCGDPYVTDIGDYSNLFIYHVTSTSGYESVSSTDGYSGTSGSVYVTNTTYDVTPEGAPRTDQDPTLIKERMGNYLKSGIMPVIDISDNSNWNLTAPYVIVRVDSSLVSGHQDSSLYQEYDFQRLLGNSGAIVVVVDTFNSSSASLSRNRILNRTAVVRAACPRCLTAVRVPGSSVGLSTYDNDLSQLFGFDPRLKVNVDMIVTDYDTSNYGNGAATAGGFLGLAGYITRLANTVIYSASSITADTRASFVINDVMTYGEAALNYSKPVIITNFTVTDDQYWNGNTYGTLFSSIVNNEDQLVKAGIIGLIYQPVRVDSSNTAGQKESLVSTVLSFSLPGTSTSIALPYGMKTTKFCALESAINRMAGTNPYATFVQVFTVPSVNCTLCTSLELAQGECGKTCDNGVQCTMPGGVPLEDVGKYKCPDETVVEPCTPCNMTNTVYNCTESFGNGTQESEPLVKSVNMVSDAYEDVMAGMSKPGKCCLTDSTGANYTYFKQMYYTSVTAPAVFSRTGNANQDCGIGTGNSLTQLGGFCGISLPVKNYDINCVPSPGSG